MIRGDRFGLRSFDCRLDETIISTARLTLLFFLFAVCIFHRVAQAQSTSATLSGTVSDQNGAVVPGVAITIINTGTGFQWQVTSSEQGYFVISLLPPSRYTVRAQRDSFAPVQIDNVILNVGDQKALQIQLKAGNITEMVKIEGGAPLMNESATVGTVVDRQFVENLPLNGRSFQSLITLTPGVVLTKTNALEPGQFSVNGQRANANYFTVDGVSANASVGAGFSLGQPSGGSLPALSSSGGTNNLVSVDALQEFKIQTSTYAPEFGRTPGAQVSIVTRSGTNDFHGALFEYFRNDVLDAKDWFANNRGLKKPALRQNDFGAVIGGPVFLPRFGEGGRHLAYDGHERTFFFFSYEGLRLRQPLVRITDVPRLADRQNALERTRPFLNAYPIPTGAAKPNGFAEFAASFSNPSTLNATSIRVDHTVSNRLTLFGRYNYAPSTNVERGAFGSLSLNTVSLTALNTQTLTLGATLALTSNISNDLRVNYSRYSGTLTSELDNFGGALKPPDSIFFPPFASSEDSSLLFVLIGGTNSTLSVGPTADNLQRQVNIVDNLSIISGSHQLKFGVDYRRLFPIINFASYSQSISSTVSQTVAGIASSARVSAREENLHPVLNNWSIYAQDTWRVTNRLTLAYGLRYEVNPPPTEHRDNEQFAVIGLDNPSTLSLAPRGTRIYNTTFSNFAPRIGVAYKVSERQGRQMIIRGGFGVFYDLGSSQATTAFSNAGFPFAVSTLLSNVSLPLTPALAVPPVFRLVPPITTTVWAFDPHLKLPYTYQWNFAIEQSVGANQTASASYVAAVGRRLLRQEGLTNPNSNFTQVNVIRNSATSDYHALQLQFQRLLSRGLQALLSFTWSKSLDIASNDSNSGPPIGRIDPRIDRGPSDFDVRYAFSSAVTYNIPVRDTGAIGKAILRNWSVDAILTARSATPVNITYIRNIGFGTFSFRPDLVLGNPLYIDDPNEPGGRRFNNTQATVPGNPLPQIGPFLRPVEPRQGTLGRNALRGFPLYQVDLALRRQFNLTERVNVQFRGEFFNVFNHPNFGDPNGLLTSANFGRSIAMFGRSLGSGGAGGGFNPLYQVGGPRSLQFALKLVF